MSELFEQPQELELSTLPPGRELQVARQKEYFDFGDMTAGEILAFRAYVDEPDDRLRVDRVRDHFVRHFEGADAIGIINSGIRHLIQTNPERAREVIAAFADSKESWDRQELLVEVVRDLTNADHDAGCALWGRLLRDEDDHVRREALYYLAEHTDRGVDENGVYGPCRLTQEDVDHLKTVYYESEPHYNRFDLGRTALHRVVKLPEPNA